MNNRNNLDARNFVYALLSGLRLAFYLAVLALILGGVFFVQCEKPKANLRVPYNPLYTNPEIADSTKHDWVKDENVCIKRRIVYDQMLNDGLYR